MDFAIKHHLNVYVHEGILDMIVHNECAIKTVLTMVFVKMDFVIVILVIRVLFVI
jgi:hypothetical protein